MATKNTIASAKKIGRPAGSKDRVQRTRSASAFVFRIARVGANGQTEYVKEFHQHTDLFLHLNKLVAAPFSAQTYGYKAAAERVCAKLNRIMKKEKHKKGDFFVEEAAVLR